MKFPWSTFDEELRIVNIDGLQMDLKKEFLKNYLENKESNLIYFAKKP